MNENVLHMVAKKLQKTMDNRVHVFCWEDLNITGIYIPDDVSGFKKIANHYGLHVVESYLPFRYLV